VPHYFVGWLCGWLSIPSRFGNRLFQRVNTRENQQAQGARQTSSNANVLKGAFPDHANLRVCGANGKYKRKGLSK
jgi:hypothetical protein